MRRFDLVPLVATLAATLVVASPAQARWNGMRWGTSEAEIRAAYPSLSPLSADVLEGRTNVNWIGIQWTRVNFGFNSRRQLIQVVAETDASLQTVVQAMARRYGRPREFGRMGGPNYTAVFPSSDMVDVGVYRDGRLRAAWRAPLNSPWRQRPAAQEERQERRARQERRR